MPNKEKITVFYHSPCLDGAAAAWSAYKKWGDDAQYVGINHDSLDETKKLILKYADADTHVVFADYTPQRQLMDEIASNVKCVDIYDHHASAIQAMEGYSNDKVNAVFDENRSGAGIVYDALFNKRRPLLINLIEMIDLEKVDSINFFAIAAYLDSLPIANIGEAVKSFDEVNKVSLDKITQIGQHIRRSNALSIEKAIDSMVWTKVSIVPDTDPIYVPIINANPQYLGREFSIRLRQLAEKNAPGFVALSWYEDKGTVRVSVRTNGIPDAGKVAAHIGSKQLGYGLGGGGHHTSAAAQFTVEQFNKMLPRMTQKEIIKELSEKTLVVENPSAKEIGHQPERKSRAK